MKDAEKLVSCGAPIPLSFLSRPLSYFDISRNPSNIYESPPDLVSQALSPRGDNHGQHRN
jgi:hypothetical protein